MVAKPCNVYSQIKWQTTKEQLIKQKGTIISAQNNVVADIVNKNLPMANCIKVKQNKCISKRNLKILELWWFCKERIIQMNDQTPQNSSKNNESNLQKAIIRPFQCGFCEKSFTQSQAAKKHERIHTGEKPFVCKICNYKSNDSGNLRKHGKKIHGIVNYLRNSPEKIGIVDKLHSIYMSPLFLKLSSI